MNEIIEKENLNINDMTYEERGIQDMLDHVISENKPYRKESSYE